jgi:hypothetical protein
MIFEKISALYFWSAVTEEKTTFQKSKTFAEGTPGSLAFAR